MEQKSRLTCYKEGCDRLVFFNGDVLNIQVCESMPDGMSRWVYQPICVGCLNELRVENGHPPLKDGDW